MTDMQLGSYRIHKPKRVAVASFRGYFYQLLYAVQYWLELDERAFLVPEGNEDIDKIVLEGKAVVSATEVQVKHFAAPLTAGSKTVKELILNSMEAFASYSAQAAAWQGVLITNTKLGGRLTPMREWLSGRPFDQVRLERQLQRLAGRKHAATFQKIKPHLRHFISGTKWMANAPDVPKVLERLGVLISLRAPQMRSEVGVNALVKRLCVAMSESVLVNRTLRAIDADLELNNAILLAQAGAEPARTGWTATVWSNVAASPYTAVAVALLVLDDQQYIERLDDKQAEVALTKNPIRREQFLEEFVFSDLAFVAYASVRQKKGRRGVRVCLRDVVRHAKRRHDPTRLLVAHDCPPWLLRWLPRQWEYESEPIRLTQVSPGTQDHVWLELAAALASIIARGPAHAVERLGTKLRWVHEVETELYYTADRPKGVAH